MQRKLLASVAAAPLLALASAAVAETTITTSVTTPVTTATANAGNPDDVRVTSAGTIGPTAAGPAITLNSNNKVTNEGAISTEDVNGSIGILALGGYSGGVANNAAISLLDKYDPTDTDGDGDLDGVYTTNNGKYGIRVIGPGTFTGDITQAGSGYISIEGDNSTAISIETTLAGNLIHRGQIVIFGDNVYAVRSTANITGSVNLDGAVTATGKGGVAASFEGDVGGQVHVQATITANAFRYTTKPFLTTSVAALDPDDLYLTGGAMRIGGNVGGGLLLDTAPADLIADDSNAATTTDSDEDGDSFADANEGTASLVAYGSAPALLIGSDTRSVTVGAVGTGDLAYGLVNKGFIQTDGVYDGIAATSLQIGGSTGQSTVVAGINNSGSITASGHEANATGLRLTSGAVVATIVNSGAISGGVTAEGLFTARGISIEAGASVTTLNNNKGGQIGAGLQGEAGNAVAIEDLAGTLRVITNSGSIAAAVNPTDDLLDKDDADLDTTNEVVTGRNIALDLRKATGGVTIVQTAIKDGDDFADGVADADIDADGVDDNEEPIIAGEILLGAFDDTLAVRNGFILGDMAFGNGADSLIIDEGATVTGGITDTDGRLGITMGKGTLSFQNAQTLNITSLAMSGESQLLVIGDPRAGTNTKLVVNGAANIGAGAQFGFTLKNVLTNPTRYTIVEAQTLTAGALSQSLVGNSPYLYIAQALADQAAGKVYLDVRARTAAELGFSKGQAAAYNAVLAAIQADDAVQSSVLAQTTRAGLVNAYDQLLPDTGEGAFAALQTANQLMSQATANRPDPYERYGPDSFWGQEINTLVRRDDGDTLGSDAQVFGFVGGYESMSNNGGALGLTLAYVNVEEHDTAAVVGENTTASVLQSGLYYRRSIGGLQLNAGAGGGYAWFDGARRYIGADMDGDGISDVIRTNEADWNGVTANAFAGVAYQAMVGRFYARPELRLDYTYLREGERKETGGGGSLDLAVDERTGSNLSGEAAISFGANFGRDVWFRPEVRVGYRQTLAGELGDTTARFGTGTPFTLVADGQDDGALTLNLALRSGTAMSYVAVEAGAEARKRQKRYNVRLSGRVMF